MRWLLITVGGSPEPIIFSIREGKYDRVVFLCSGESASGPGSVAMVTGGPAADWPAAVPALPGTIPRKSGLHRSQWRIADLVAVDDVGSVFASARSAINSIRWEDPHPEIDIDYTAGSKSMSAGLMLAAVEEGLVTGRLISPFRPDLKSVADGTQVALSVSLPAVGVTQALREAEALLASFDYRGAGAVLERTLSRAPQPLKAEIQRNIIFCRALDAWDKCDYEKAAELAKSLQPEMRPHAECLEVLRGGESRRLPALVTLVSDLLARARRRAATDAFGEAVRYAAESFAVLTTSVAQIYDIAEQGQPREEKPGDLSPAIRVWDRLAARKPPDAVASLYGTYRGVIQHQQPVASVSPVFLLQPARALWGQMESVGLLRFTDQCLRLLRDSHELPAYPDWPDRLIRNPNPGQFRS